MLRARKRPGSLSEQLNRRLWRLATGVSWRLSRTKRHVSGVMRMSLLRSTMCLEKLHGRRHTQQEVMA